MKEERLLKIVVSAGAIGVGILCILFAMLVVSSSAPQKFAMAAQDEHLVAKDIEMVIEEAVAETESEESEESEEPEVPEAAEEEQEVWEEVETVAYSEPVDYYDEYYQSGSVLNVFDGVNDGPSGRETYYNLNMGTVVSNAQNSGISGEYWVRDDGVKMIGDYIMVAADKRTYPYGAVVETSLGTGVVVDCGCDPGIVDVAVTW